MSPYFLFPHISTQENSIQRAAQGKPGRQRGPNAITHTYYHPMSKLCLLYSTLIGPSSECSTANHSEESAPWSNSTLLLITWEELFSTPIYSSHHPVSPQKPEFSTAAEAGAHSIRQKHPQCSLMLQILRLRTLGLWEEHWWEPFLRLWVDCWPWTYVD